MPTKIVNLGDPRYFLKPASPIAVRWAFQPRADISDAVTVGTELEQGSTGDGVELDMAKLSVLAARDSENTALEVHVLPAQTVLFASAHSGMQRKIKLWFTVRA